MNRVLLIILTIVSFAVGAVAMFYIALHAVPSKAMEKAIDRISENGQNINTWTHAKRTTAASRAVVRPSPDLAYSACAYDLSDGPVRIKVSPVEDIAYWSLSTFDGETNNFYAVNDLDAKGAGADIVLAREGADTSSCDLPVVESPTDNGLALIRRLAPTAEAFERVETARKTDVCAPIVEAGC
tara:strand:+ start:1470 stop:2021 length:552 start_codon:yes stop_codon:yes gene_type:complete